MVYTNQGAHGHIQQQYGCALLCELLRLLRIQWGNCVGRRERSCGCHFNLTLSHGLRLQHLSARVPLLPLYKKVGFAEEGYAQTHCW